MPLRAARRTPLSCSLRAKPVLTSGQSPTHMLCVWSAFCIAELNRRSAAWLEFICSMQQAKWRKHASAGNPLRGDATFGPLGVTSKIEHRHLGTASHTAGQQMWCFGSKSQPLFNAHYPSLPLKVCAEFPDDWKAFLMGCGD